MIRAEGSNGTLSFDGHTVTIERSGFRAKWLVGGGDKSIPIDMVAAVEWKDAGFVVGYIKLSIGGGSERRRKSGKAMDPAYDENTVTFKRGMQPAFEAIRDVMRQAVEARVASPPTPPLLPPPAVAEPAAPGGVPSIADELAKLAGLRDQGVITQQEFDQAKARLLGG
ncbi:DUF4429 domain-containing protein [Streptomyces sp. NBRC 109706]|uniref:DUF4429 domain-containing protein n=1 Tax=Streptomyces sp. NBRC 109706 TaxID=1550035 RepID=UPI0007816156|nr:DUF4429 domain-containing protein [Streptomyces sp. NBRC 109706]